MTRALEDVYKNRYVLEKYEEIMDNSHDQLGNRFGLKYVCTTLKKPLLIGCLLASLMSLLGKMVVKRYAIIQFTD